MEQNIKTYFLRNINFLEELDNTKFEQENHDAKLPNTFALIYVYPNGDIERVLRTINLDYHYYAIQNLYDKSFYLKNYATRDQASDMMHFEFDEALVKNGVVVIYYSSPNLFDKDAFGYIHLPEELSDSQKSILLQYRSSFSRYRDILFTKFDSMSQSQIDLNEFDSGIIMDVLDDIIKGNEVQKNKSI